VIVLDSSALLAILKQESGASIVEGALAEAAISTVNVSEILSKVSDWGLDATAYEKELISLSIEYVDFNFVRAALTAQLRKETRAYGLSLGDRACLALAVERKCAVLTADRNWAKLDLGIPIELIR
jgi:PIN domain nuclease of toxin-antitoxin system